MCTIDDKISRINSIRTPVDYHELGYRIFTEWAKWNSPAYAPNEYNLPAMPHPVQQGWQCPLCQRVYAPHMPSCDCAVAHVDRVKTGSTSDVVIGDPPLDASTTSGKVTIYTVTGDPYRVMFGDPSETVFSDTVT